MYEPHTNTWDRGEVHWNHPRLVRGGILVGRYAFAPHTDTDAYLGVVPAPYLPRLSRTLFEGFDEANDTLSRAQKLNEDEWIVPLTLANAWTFLSLPFTDELDRFLVQEQINYVLRLKRECTIFLADRSSTEPDPEVPGGMHRRVVTERVESGTEVRDYTEGERIRMRRGLAGPTLAERTSSTSKVISTPCGRHARWQQYVPKSRRLYSQQVQGAEVAYRVRRVPIWYTPRTGKTATALAVHKRLLAEGEVSVLIVICPKGNLYDPWFPECERFGLRVWVLDGSPQEDADSIAACAEAGGVILVNYERVGDRHAALREAFEDRWDEVSLVCDETSAVKNPDAQRTKALFEFSYYPLALFILLNGTPFEQGPSDFWSQVHLLDPYGILWGRTYKDYERSWLVTYGEGGKVAVQPKRRVSFEILVAQTSLRCIQSEADQFMGRDKTFRYPKIKASAAQVAQARNIEAGFVELLDGSLGEVNTNLMVVYGALRELCAGYSKWKDGPEAGLPYHRERLEVDPKMMWVEAYLRSQMTQPVVFGCEFNEQELMLIELLDRLGIRWSGTSERPTYTRVRWITADANGKEWEQCREHLDKLVARGHLQEVPDWDSGASAWREYRPAVEWFEQTYPKYVTRITRADPGKKRDAHSRAAAVQDFQEGRVQCFILKHAEGRGITLNRLPAVLRNESVFPDIISLSPTWSLGTWDQFCDRCMGSDPRTNRSINTPIYVLAIEGSMDDYVMNALRGKKDVQAQLLQDAGRVGYRNFVHDLVERMAGGDDAEGEGDHFDAENMLARIVLGIAPYAKLTERVVYARLGEQLSMTAKKATEWLGERPPGAAPTLVDDAGRLVRPRDGDPDGLRTAAWYLLEAMAQPQASAAK